jgi:hypothetical protein
LAIASVLLSSLLVPSALAEEIAVPVRAQVELLAKVASYDRNFRARSGPEAKVLILVQRGNAESLREGGLLMDEIAQVSTIGGLPARPTIVHFTTPQALAEVVRDRRAAIVFLSTGLSEQTAAIGAALSGVDVLSAGLTAAYAQAGVVLAFELQSGRPKIVINLAQARKQNVVFSPELLKLARVIQ